MLDLIKHMELIYGKHMLLFTLSSKIKAPSWNSTVVYCLCTWTVHTCSSPGRYPCHL